MSRKASETYLVEFCDLLVQEALKTQPQAPAPTSYRTCLALTKSIPLCNSPLAVLLFTKSNLTSSFEISICPLAFHTACSLRVLWFALLVLSALTLLEADNKLQALDQLSDSDDGDVGFGEGEPDVIRA